MRLERQAQGLGERDRARRRQPREEKRDPGHDGESRAQEGQPRQALDEGIALERITELPVYRQLQRAAEEIPEDKLDRYQLLLSKLDDEFDRLTPETARAR